MMQIDRRQVTLWTRRRFDSADGSGSTATSPDLSATLIMRRVHMRSGMVTTKTFTCITCEHDFESPAGLSQHVALAHKECAACGETFSTASALDEHTVEEH